MPATFSGLLILSIFPVLLIAAGIGDFLTMRIPNWLNVALVISFFVMIFVAGMPFAVLKWHLAAAGAVFAAGLVLFFTIGIGGGDAKLLAAGALWLGWSALMPFLFYTVLAGGVLALLVVIWRKIGHESDVRGLVWFRELFSKKIQMPYGVAIAIGGIAAFPESWWVKSLI
jgi:prepilin peptidase CpaA